MLLAGCASAPFPVSPMNDPLDREGSAIAQKITYENRSELMLQELKLITRPINVLNITPSGKNIVDSAVREFFNSRITVGTERATRSVVVQINQGDIGFRLSKASYIPLVGGLAAHASEHDIVGTVEITLLVLDSTGKVIATESFRESIESRGLLGEKHIDVTLGAHINHLHSRLSRHFDEKFFDRFFD